jgi:hypothetical protein
MNKSIILSVSQKEAFNILNGKRMAEGGNIGKRKGVKI